MSEVPCNLCGSSDVAVVFEAGVAQNNRIVRCKACELMFASPLERSADIDQIVSWDPQFVYEQLTSKDPERIEKQTLQRRDHDITRKILAERHPDRGKLVELGSGLGYLLDYFRSDQWDVLGVEPNVGHAMYAEKALKIPTIASTLEDARLPSASVDAMLMFHVIEHVPDPSATLREIHRVLKPGRTLVLETPRYDSLMFRLLGRRERSVSCDGHIFFFTTKTLSSLLEKCGFQIVRCAYVGRSLTYGRLLFNLGVMSKSKAVAGTLQKFATRLKLNKRTLYLNARDMMRFYVARV